MKRICTDSLTSELSLVCIIQNALFLAVTTTLTKIVVLPDQLVLDGLAGSMS